VREKSAMPALKRDEVVEASKVAPATPTTIQPARASAQPIPTAMATPAASAGDPHADLQTLIPALADLLEAHDLTGYLETAMSPSMLSFVMQSQTASSLDELAEKSFPTTGTLAKLTDAYITTLTQDLRALQGQAPVLDATGTTATYELSQPIKGQKIITFKKMNGLWYQLGI